MVQQKKRGRAAGKNALWMVLLVFALVGAALGTVLIANGGELPFLSKKVEAGAEEQDVDRTGQIALPLSARPMEAFGQVTREDLFDPRTKQFRVLWLAEEDARNSGMILDAKQVLGRVLARDKQPGYGFVEADFLPKGTKPGWAAGLAPGTRGYTVETDKVPGLRSLERFDRFDLVAMKSVRSSASGDRSLPAEVRGQLADEAAWGSSKRVLVSDGRVIVPNKAVAGGKKKSEVIIQVAEQEWDALAEALAVDAEIVCLPRSNQPGAASTPLPEIAKPPKMKPITVIRNGKTETQWIPDDSEEPEMGTAPEDQEAKQVAKEPLEEKARW